MEIGQIIANLPEELKALPQWVCTWDGSKIPMQVSEIKAASASNPSTWGSFDDAVYCISEQIYNYLGFVFDDNGIVGIDIDIGFDEEGIGLSEMAYDVLNVCKSYTELSKSGRGFHIYVKGDLPFKGRNNGKGLEIYKDDRFFVVTGRKIRYDKIVTNQEAIDYILDKYFPQEVKASEKGLKSTRIYNPEWQASGKGIPLKRKYPEIPEGNRHMSILSLAGQLHMQGYSEEEIFRELCKANKEACRPELEISEIEHITRSIMKYER